MAIISASASLAKRAPPIPLYPCLDVVHEWCGRCRRHTHQLMLKQMSIDPAERCFPHIMPELSSRQQDNQEEVIKQD
jgi:hypothetical protein